MSTALIGGSPPVAPPMKKMRGGSTPHKLDDRMDDAVARRRAELQRLKQQKNQSSVLSQARHQLNGGGSRTASAAPPVIPSGNGLSRVRHSDLFPTVTKTPSAFANATTTGPTTSTSTTSSATNNTTNKPPPVARRLEASFTSNAPTVLPGKAPPRSRSKSAPPSRPKPPPPRRRPAPPPGVAASTDITTTTNDKNQTIPPRLLPQAPNSAPSSPTHAIQSTLTNAASAGAPPLAVLSPPEEDTRRVDFQAQKSIQMHTPAPTNSGWEKTQAAGHTPFVPKMSVGFAGGAADEITATASTSTSTDDKVIPTTKSWDPTTADDSSAQKTPFQKAKTNAGATPFPKKEENDTSPVTPFPGTMGNAGVTPFPKEKQPEEVTPTQEEDGTKTTAGVTPFFPRGKTAVTPFPGTTTASQQPSATKDLLRSVAASLDPPQTPELRFQKEVQRLEEEKAKALKQVADLQKQVLQSKLADTSSSSSSSNNNKMVGFMSPGSPLSPRPSRKFVKTPMPKRRHDPPDQKLLVQATQQTVHEFESPAATFVIRRPYGLATERELWYSTAGIARQVYQEQATATEATTLEVVAQIAADGSMLVLTDQDTVRHYKDGAWKEYASDSQQQQQLGQVLYIDEDANEREYCLDEIYQGAKAVREHYAAAVVNMVSALEGQKMTMMNGTHHHHAAATQQKKSPTKDMGTNTPQQQQRKAAAQPKQEAAKLKKPKKKSAAPPEDDVGILSSFIGIFSTFVFGLLWSLLVKIPLRILSTTIVLACSFVILGTIRLYAAHDHGAYELGAGVENVHLYNRPGLV